MKRLSMLAVFLLLLFISHTHALSNALHAAESPKRARPAKSRGELRAGTGPTTTLKAGEETNFKSLFNGKHLAGWEGDASIWSVKDGAITGQTTKETRVSENNFLIWKGGKVADFELRLKFRLVGGNSGIYFHSQKRAPGEKGEPLVGPQADFSADNRWTGVLMEYTRREILAERGEKVLIDEKGNKRVIRSVGDTKELLKAVRNEQWNAYTVISKGGHVVLKINGVVMCDVQDNDPRRVPSGLLALQVHVGPPMLVQFKDIRLREL